MTIDLERSDLLDKVEGLWGGSGNFQNFRFLDDAYTIGDLSKEVIPFLALDRAVPAYVSRHFNRDYFTSIGHNNGKIPIENLCDLSQLENKPFIKAYLLSEIKSHIGISFPHGYSQTMEDSMKIIVAQKGELIDGIEAAKRSITNKLLNIFDEYGIPDTEGELRRYWSSYWKYKETLGHFLMGSGFKSQRTRTMIQGNNLRYMVGSYFLADISTSNVVIPLICLVTKPKYVEYIKYCLALSKKIDSRVFQVWVHPEFDVPRSRWRGIRPYMRKEFLIPMYDAGVPIVEKRSIDELFKTMTIPEMATIPEYKQWLKDCAKESIINLQKTIYN